jgi:hypothetical protein
MKKTLACMTLVMFTATGCLEKDEGGSEAEARDAIPSAEFLKIAMPASDGTAKPIVGQVSPFYLVTLGTALQLNLSVGAFLTLVRIIVAFPVTSIEGDTWIWGPWHDEGKPGEYRLSVRLNEEGNYEWNLEGRKFGETGAFVALVRGIAEPGRRTAARGPSAWTSSWPRPSTRTARGRHAERDLRPRAQPDHPRARRRDGTLRRSTTATPRRTTARATSPSSSTPTATIRAPTSRTWASTRAGSAAAPAAPT